MKPISLHPISVLVGLALAGLVAFSTGAAQSVQPIPTRTQVFGRVPAEWWTHVALTTITNGGTNTRQDVYTVPADRYFVITASLLTETMTVNGVNVGLHDVLRPTMVNDGEPNEPTRCVFAPGTVLTMPPCQGNCSQNTTAHLWGYLEPL